MSILNKLQNVCNDPDWVTEKLYLSGFQDAHLRCELSVLVEEGYLKSTPLLLYLAKLIDAKFSSTHYNLQAASSLTNGKGGNSSPAISQVQNQKGSTLNTYTDDNFESTTWQDVDSESFYSRSQELIEKLKTLVQRLGAHKHAKPTFLARKIMFESSADPYTLTQDISALELAIEDAVKSTTKKRKRVRSRNRKRGGRKNKKVKQGIE